MPGENILEWTIYKHSDFFIVSLSVPGSCIFLYTFERYTRPCAISHSPLETVTPSGGRERSAASEILAVVYKAFLPPWSRLVSVPLEYTPWFGNRLSAVRPSSFPYTGCLVLNKRYSYLAPSSWVEKWNPRSIGLFDHRSQTSFIFPRNDTVFSVHSSCWWGHRNAWSFH